MLVLVTQASEPSFRGLSAESSAVIQPNYKATTLDSAHKARNDGPLAIISVEQVWTDALLLSKSLRPGFATSITYRPRAQTARPGSDGSSHNLNIQRPPK